MLLYLGLSSTPGPVYGTFHVENTLETNLEPVRDCKDQRLTKKVQYGDLGVEFH
jgi:hypothetical protein